jgi:hypothetical protein
MIRSGVIWAIHQSATLFVALAVQVVALVFVGDMFVSAPRAEATPSQPDVTVARVAPFARGERLMMADPTVDLAPETSASTTQTGSRCRPRLSCRWPPSPRRSQRQSRRPRQRNGPRRRRR